MAAIPVSEEKHCCWNFWLVFTLACLKAHFGPSPIPRVPFSATHTRHTHTLYWRSMSCAGTHPCQAVLKVLLTSWSLTATKTFNKGQAYIVKSFQFSWVVLKLLGLNWIAWVAWVAFSYSEGMLTCHCCKIAELGWAQKQKVGRPGLQRRTATQRAHVRGNKAA